MYSKMSDFRVDIISSCDNDMVWLGWLLAYSFDAILGYNGRHDISYIIMR